MFFILFMQEEKKAPQSPEVRRSRENGMNPGDAAAEREADNE